MEKPTKSTTKPKVTPLNGGAFGVAEPPSHLSEEHRPFWRRLRRQVEISHAGVTPAAESLIDAAAMAHQAEHQARVFAAEAAEAGDSQLYLKFQSEARAESRAMRGALNGLRLAGDRSSATAKDTVSAVDRATQKQSGRWE
ncbi:hypothetical protein [Tateyamaria sp. Alg231-49]|uniref:hypothetical protein n=1 Tax=Tateyamaria sp. Alg231-49 TaxID=1922219 RepID=UPI000D5587D3|nr:hypothetical protein [Tateyamaria sp. Alg231-49]